VTSLHFLRFTFWNYNILKLLHLATIMISDATLSIINVVLCYVFSQYQIISVISISSPCLSHFFFLTIVSTGDDCSPLLFAVHLLSYLLLLLPDHEYFSLPVNFFFCGGQIKFFLKKHDTKYFQVNWKWAIYFMHS
jgi:hypothetical protein